jgi:hypothetical protein
MVPMRVNSEKAMIKAIELRRSSGKTWGELATASRERAEADKSRTPRTAAEVAGA